MRKRHPSHLPKASAKYVNEEISDFPCLLEFLTDHGLVRAFSEYCVWQQT